MLFHTVAKNGLIENIFPFMLSHYIGTYKEAIGLLNYV